MKLLFVLLPFLFCNCLTEASSVHCEDGVDNVVTGTDCGDGSSLVTFADIAVQTYDEKQQPACIEDGGKKYGLGTLPGYLKIKSVTIRVKQTLTLETNAEFLLNMEKLDSWLIHKLCNDGVGVGIMPTEFCHFPLCKSIGDDMCHMFDQAGTYTLKDIPEQFQGLIHVPSFPGVSLALDGKWNVGTEIRYNGHVIGCAIAKNAHLA